MKTAFALAFLLAATAADASSVDVDILYQKAPENEWLSSGFGRATWISQSFTSGVSGSLDKIDLQIYAFGSENLRFRLGSGEAIEGTYAELLTFDILAADVPMAQGGLLSLDLSGYGLQLQQGSLYSVILSSTQTGGGAQFGWIIGERAPDGEEFANPAYAGGQAFGSSDQGQTWSIRGVDRPLRTWMTAAVPEPASWAMLIAGFGLVGSAVRRQRAVTA